MFSHWLDRDAVLARFPEHAKLARINPRDIAAVRGVFAWIAANEYEIAAIERYGDYSIPFQQLSLDDRVAYYFGCDPAKLAVERVALNAALQERLAELFKEEAHDV